MYKQYTCAPAQLASLAHNFLEPPRMPVVEKKKNNGKALGGTGNSLPVCDKHKR
jgi:hypothetical protein